MKRLIFGVLALSGSLFATQTIVSEGEVLVNDKKLTKSTVIKVGDFIKTKKNAKVRFNIGNSAFLAKGNSRFSITKEGDKQTLNVLTGGVLAVFKHGEGKHSVKTPNMTAGIRGTGVFAEVKNNKSYFCTCYGETNLESEGHVHMDGASITHKNHKHFKTGYHKMVWVKENGEIKDAKEMRGHTDEDLRTLEAMVGRVPDFDKR
jgi:ribosomal 50S subunit-recycling heat shock protein